MWNERLVACAQAYPSAVLTTVDAAGYPISVRCVPEFDAAQEVIRFKYPPLPVPTAGMACLLFHYHDAQLSGQREMMIKGRLTDDGDALALQPTGFLTGSGRDDTDRLPFAGSPADMFRFMLYGRRKAREYLAKRGTPWPPTPWQQLIRSIDDDPHT